MKYGTNKHHVECFGTCCNLRYYLEGDCSLEDGKKKEICMVYCLACLEHNWNSSNNLSLVLPEAEEERKEEEKVIRYLPKKERICSYRGVVLY